MPNWCFGNVNIIGKPKDVEGFANLFLWGRDELEEEPKEYFARSFPLENREWLEENLKGKLDKEGNIQLDILVDFAWSAYSCLIDGYPTQKDNKNCITLENALKKYPVSVEIITEEGGLMFEEMIKGNKEGVFYDSRELDNFICLDCEEEQFITTYSGDGLNCKECGSNNLKLIIKPKGEENE